MKLLLILLTLFVHIKTQTQFLHFLMAVQNQDQIYYCYIPYIDSCQYNQQYMQPGGLTIIPFSATILFDKLYMEETIAFWYPVYQGYNIAAVISQQIQGLYSGYILYNSLMQGLNRDIILYNVNESGLTFYYTLISINSQLMSLTFNTKSSIQINLTDQAYNILIECNETSSTNFAYIGNSSFLYVCSQFSNGFIFTPNNQSNIQIVNFSELQSGSYSVVTNFQLYNFQKYSEYFHWNCTLMVTSANLSSLYFLKYDNQTQNFTSTNMNDLQNQTVLILNRIWGQQNRFQLGRWTEVQGSINIPAGLYIPGDIVSIYVNDLQSIFIQSAAQQVNYLCIFNSKGTLYANFTFQGQVLYYGDQIIFIYNQENNQVFIYQVQRPSIVIDASQFGNNTTPSSFSYLNRVIQCEWVQISINFAILWTSIEYPAALIQPLDLSTIYTDDSLFGFQISQKFFKVGPDFKVIPETGPGISAQVIQSLDQWLDNNGVGILNITTYGGSNFQFVVITTSCIYQISSQNKPLVLVNQPCGFSDIISAQIINYDQFLVTNSQGLTCLCQPSYDLCTIIKNTNEQIYQNQHTSQNTNSFIPLQTNQTVLFKMNLYQLIEKGFIISILQNNSVFLFEIKTRSILDTVTMDCPAQNLTNGLIYTREFFNPYLILFCEGGEYLSQFIIVNYQIVPQRIIPLYGFKTRIGELSIQSTNTYIFLSVDSIVDIYPPLQACCVLRLNPTDDTTSVIVQVINASSIVATESYQKFDFVLLNVMTPTGEKSLIRVYIPQKWLALNLTNTSQIIALDQNVTLSFNSPLYNFGAIFNITITFNLSSVNLSFLNNEVFQTKQNTIVFNTTFTGQSTTPTFSSVVNYNFSQLVCGPIFNSYFARGKSQQKNFRISQTYILKQNKLIGGSGINFIQIIDPRKWIQPSDFTLNNLLIFVSDQKMYVYAKQINNVQLVNVGNFTLPEKSCTYYPYQILNSTAVTLTSNCQGLDFNFQTPFLTINYNTSTNDLAKAITMNYTLIGVPLSLRNINTIAINNSNTMIVGILQGPMYTQTGRLIIFVNKTWSPLYISSSYSFLIDYSCFSSSASSPYFIMTVNPFIISIFISPVVQPNRTQTSPNYTFIYTTRINEKYCSTIKILNATLQFSYIILSCSDYYYFLYLNFTNNGMTILKKFVRYSQCALYDYHKPQQIFINNTLLVLFAECKQNEYAFKMSAYEQILSPNAINIYTGFLQVFTMSGPLGPNCSVYSMSPIRVIPISTSMYRALFLPYIFKNVYKFVYSQIQGIIIDNFIQIFPKITLTYQPYTEDQQQFPSMQFSVYNEFHQQNKIIFTSVNVPNESKLKYIGFVVFWIYVLLNLITLIFIISYYANNTTMDRISLAEEEVSEDEQIKYSDENSNREEKRKSSNQNRNTKNRQSTIRDSLNRRTVNYQLQLFFAKPSNNSFQSIQSRG